MSKTAAKIFICVWSVVLVLFGVLFGYLCYSGGWGSLGGYSYWSGDNTTFQQLHDQTITEPVNALQLDWKGGDVTLFPGDGQEVKIIQRGVKNTPADQFFRTSVKNGVLTVSDGNRVAGLRIGPFSYSIGSDLEIHLPQKTYETISLRTSGGDVSGETLDAGKLDVTTASGDIFLSGNFQKLEMTSTSGDLVCRDVSVDQLVLDTTSGDVDCEGELSAITATSTSGELCFRTSRMITGASISSTSGDVMLALPENDGFTARLNTAVGDLLCEFGSDGGHTYQYKDGGAEIQMDTTSGDVYLQRS